MANSVIYGQTFSGADFTSINAFAPVYGSPRPDDFDFSEFSETNTDTVGIYWQDQITLVPNLKLLVGGRLDLIDNDTEFIPDLINGSDTEETSENYNAFSPRARTRSKFPRM